MSEATTPDRDEEMLSRLAEFDLAAAERVHGRLMPAVAARWRELPDPPEGDWTGDEEPPPGGESRRPPDPPSSA